MQHRNLFVGIVLALISSSATLAADSEQTHISIYSGDYDAVYGSPAYANGPGFALVRQQWRQNIKAGGETITLSNLPYALDSSTVELSLPVGMSIRSQRFDFATAEQHELLQRSIGAEVIVEKTQGERTQQYRGVLLSAGSGLTIQEADGRVRFIAQYDNFHLNKLPDGLVTQPTLRFDILGGKSQAETLQLEYATAGLAWRAEYAMRLSSGPSCRMDFSGVAMVANRSGQTFNAEQLTLIAGEPNRVRNGRSDIYVAEMAAPAPPMKRAMMEDAAPTATASGENYAYPYPRPVVLSNGSAQRLPLIDSKSDASCARRYVIQSGSGNWMPRVPIIDQHYANQGELMVLATVKFKNDKKSGLGAPLPAGRVRMFEGDAFLGEASLAHTAAEREIELAIGKSFDLSAQREAKDFQVNRSGRVMTESFEIVLRNAKSEAVTIELEERLPRWSDWQIQSSTHRFEKIDSQTIRMPVSVPAGGEQKVRYTVTYQWPADIKVL